MDRTAARDYPPGNLRVSDAERDQALSELSEAFQAGRITSEEFDQRSDQVLRARTGKELTALLADLPRDKPLAAPPANGSSDLSMPPSHGSPATRIAVGGCVALIVVAGLAVLRSMQDHVLFGHHSGLVGSGSGGLIVVLVLVLVFLRVAHGRR